MNVIEEHFNLRGCDSSKGYGYFIDLIFYLDGRYEELPYAKAIIEVFLFSFFFVVFSSKKEKRKEKLKTQKK